jgi:hypothetical protein
MPREYRAGFAMSTIFESFARRVKPLDTPESMATPKCY